jgi:protein-disulfide isomerase
MSALKPIVDLSRDHFAGYPSAPIELVQYGDFECGFCATAYSVIKLLKAKMGNRLNFIFRHYPQHNLHALALEAAIAAEAAGMQNKFWAMHDLIFENQKYLSRGMLTRFADEIGLDPTLFENPGSRKLLSRKVISDFESGVRSGVNGTPAFFINGRKYNGFDDYDSLLKTCTYSLELSDMETKRHKEPIARKAQSFIPGIL